jgi:putative membrane protein
MIRQVTMMLAVSAAASALACSHEREVMTPASRTTSMPGQGDSDSKERALSDAQIAGILEAANQAEIQQGTLAQRMARRPEVRDFATMMVTDHSKALEDGRHLATKAGFGTASSEQTSELRAGNQEAVSELNEATIAEFDEKYIDVQIQAHEHVLELLDDDLIPNAVNAELRASLFATRPVVATHLERARNIKRKLE